MGVGVRARVWMWVLLCVVWARVWMEAWIRVLPLLLFEGGLLLHRATSASICAAPSPTW